MAPPATISFCQQKRYKIGLVKYRILQLAEKPFHTFTFHAEILKLKYQSAGK